MNRVLQARFLQLLAEVSPRRFASPSAVFFSKTSLPRNHGCSHYSIGKLRQDHLNRWPSRRLSCAFSSNSTSQDLSTKKCVPCNSKDIRPMSEQSANELLPQVQGWNLVKEDATLKLQKSWKVKSFTKGLEFFQIVADVAEAEGHHPDLHLVGWNNVKIDIWTHSVGGLTENDFILAAKINTLNLESLLRRKPAKE